VILFIEDLAPGRDLSQERFAFGETPLHAVRCSDDDVQRKRRIAFELDFYCLIELISRRHDHEDVDVTVGVRSAISMRAEQDDLVGLKAFGDLTGKSTNQAHGNVRSAVPAGQASFRFLVAAIGTHWIIT
jgi:hypothetical protein